MPFLLLVPLMIFLPIFVLGFLSVGAASDTASDGGGSLLGSLLGSTAAVVLANVLVIGAIVFLLFRSGFFKAMTAGLKEAWRATLKLLGDGVSLVTLGIL